MSGSVGLFFLALPVLVPWRFLLVFLLNLGYVTPNYYRKPPMRSSKAPLNQKNRGHVLPHPLQTWPPSMTSATLVGGNLLRHFRCNPPLDDQEKWWFILVAFSLPIIPLSCPRPHRFLLFNLESIYGAPQRDDPKLEQGPHLSSGERLAVEGTAYCELGNDSILLPKAKTLAKEIGIERLDWAGHPGADPPGDRGVARGPSDGEGVRLRVTEGSGPRYPVSVELNRGLLVWYGQCCRADSTREPLRSHVWSVPLPRRILCIDLNQCGEKDPVEGARHCGARAGSYRKSLAGTVTVAIRGT